MTALRLALALPLACAVLIGALWVGHSLRAYRAPAESPAPSASAGDVSQAAAGVQVQGQPTQYIELPESLAPAATSRIEPSPDGSYLIGRSADFKALAIVRVIAERDAGILKSELVATIPDVSFDAWLPDGRAFVAHGTSVLSAAPGGKAQMKTYDVLRIDVAGTKTKLGEALGGPFALSADAKLLAAFDGDSHLITIRTDGTGTQSVAGDPTAGSLPAFLGWDATGAIVRADYREPFSLRRIPLAGSATVVAANGARSVSTAHWSPDHKAAIVTVTGASGERDGLLTDAVGNLPADAFPAWVGPHLLLTRASDEHAGTIDVLTGARTPLSAKMRSAKIRVLAVSLPHVLWLDESKGVVHLLDVAGDRDSGVGLSPAPARAEPLSAGRFLAFQDTRLVVLDSSAWWHNVPATPSPIPQSKDQGGVPTGFVRVESPEGGWSAVMPKTWYRRDAPMHGSELLSYDPQDMDFSGNAPPAGEVRIVVGMPNDYGAADLHAYARGFPFSGGGNKVKAEADVTVAGQPAYVATIFMNNPKPFAQDVRFWLTRSPFFSDRMVTIQAGPADGRTAQVDAIVASLRFFKPSPPPPATITRAQVMAQYSTPTFSATRVDRVDAKLVRWKDYESAVGTFRSGVNDPDELTWVVVVYGEIQPPNRGPAGRPTPAPGATPQTYRWEVHTFPAFAGGVGGMYSCCGPDLSPPAWWDKLVDLGK